LGDHLFALLISGNQDFARFLFLFPQVAMEGCYLTPSPWICLQNQALHNYLTALLAIMSDSHSSTRTSAPFAPRAFVPVTVGRTAVNLYPVIDQSMPPHERAHAFHINGTALSSQSFDLHAQLDALGHQLNLSVTVDGVIQDWLRHFYDRWSDFPCLSILSFHNTKGT